MKISIKGNNALRKSKQGSNLLTIEHQARFRLNICLYVKSVNQKLNFAIGRDCTKTRHKNLFRTSLLVDYKVCLFQTGIGI